MPTGLMIIVFLAATAGFVALFMFFGGKKADPRGRALRRLGVAAPRHIAQAPSSVLKKEILLEHNQARKRFRLPRSNSLTKLLDRSGCGMRSNAFMMLCLVMAAGGGTTWLANQSILSAAAAAGALGIVPYFYVKMKYKRRRKLFTEQFPDALELLTSTLRSGQAFATGLISVADEMPDPISAEFRMAFDEQNYGVPMEQALLNMADRIGTMDADFFVTAINIQREVGGNLAEVLDNLGKTIRQRFRILGHIKSLTAQGKLSGIVVGLMPAGLCLVLQILNPEYMGQLFTTELGRILLYVSVGMQFVGFLWIRKIVQIKV
jgi:tight adherence protein B